MYIDRGVYMRENIHIYRQGCMYICERAAVHYCAGWHRGEREHSYI